jgi:pimeloyl-ACP methyl ester carboxylesterase
MEVVARGRSVFLADQGKGVDPARPTVLFLHGAGMDHSVWPLQARHFAYRGWNALCLDLPGHGRSEALADDGRLLDTIAGMADWLTEVTGALGLEDVHLVGHSMGALIALEAASRDEAPIAKIALLGAAPAMPVHPALLEAAGGEAPLAAEMICDWGFGPAGRFGGHPAPGSWMQGHALQLLTQSTGRLLQTDLAACNSYERGMEAAAAVTCPALVVAGRVDRMTPYKASAKLAEALPSGRLVVIEGAGHMMMIERADATLDALRDHVLSP